MMVIGLDIGTTCTKALLADDRGQILGVGSSGYPLISNGNHIEQRAEDWIDAAVNAIQEVTEGRNASEVGAISLSTQGGGTVPIDEKGNFVGNSFTWMDKRAEKERLEIIDLLGGEYIYRTSGWRASAAMDAAKVRYMKKAGIAGKGWKYLTTLEVLNRFLTGRIVVDPTNAAMRQLYNVEKNDWDEKLMEAGTITREELPEVKPTGAQIGTLTEEAAVRMGLKVGIPVFNGAHDQYCASIGGGVVSEGEMLLSAGTTWVLMGVGKKPLFTESHIAPGRHPVKGLYGAITSLVGSGASMQWLKNEFLPESFDEMNREVEKRREKTKDLFFYPYLAGAPYPIWNQNAKGVFAGLTLEHDRFDLARALMEGVAFGVKRGLEDFRENGCEIQKLTIMGGAAKSPQWCQMIASIIDIPVIRLNQADVCALGAAMIAACGLGIYGDYAEAAEALVRTEHIYEPLPEETSFYWEKFSEFDRLWRALELYYKK